MSSFLRNYVHHILIPGLFLICSAQALSIAVLLDEHGGKWLLARMSCTIADNAFFNILAKMFVDGSYTEAKRTMLHVLSDVVVGLSTSKPLVRPVDELILHLAATVLETSVAVLRAVTGVHAAWHVYLPGSRVDPRSEGIDARSRPGIFLAQAKDGVYHLIWKMSSTSPQV